MRLLNNVELNKVLSFLKEDLCNCLYLYIDLFKYGTENKNCTTWINDGETIQTIVLNYYDSAQIYMRENDVNRDNVLELLDLIEKLDLKMLSYPSYIEKDMVFQSKIRESYFNHYGKVVKCKRFFDIPGEYYIERATESDMSEVAELICSDDEFSSNYETENLAVQLKDRLNDHMGRNLIVKDKGKIIAHIATYAEVDHIAITSGLIVGKDYRNSLLGVAIEHALIKELWSEQYEVYTFVKTKIREKFHERMGNAMCGKYSTAVKIEEEK